MYSEEAIRDCIKTLYEQTPQVHMNVSLKRPTVRLENAEATIIGVYRHFFQVEECSCGIVKRHSLQYADIFTGNIQILELNNTLPRQ